MRIFKEYLDLKYCNIQSVICSYEKPKSCGIPQILREAEVLDLSISMEEVHVAVGKAKRKKAQGPDGIFHEFYIKMWGIMKNELLDIIHIMYLEGLLSEAQKHGHIVCLPKIGFPAHTENYSPLTILNTDYKILTRIIANRLRTRMKELLHSNQYCGRNDKSIYVVATVRDTITYAEDTQKPICLPSIDFKDTFDNILREYGISETFCKRLKAIYAEATSNLTLNVHTLTSIKYLAGCDKDVHSI